MTVAPPAAALPPVSVRLRLAAMVYEATLLFGVVFGASYALLAILGWTYPLAAAQRWTLQGVLFVVVGAYFVFCWRRGGQTLAAKAWRLRVEGADGAAPSLRQALLRYLFGWHLLLPGLVSVLVFPGRPWLNLTATLAGLIVLVALARFDPQRQLLHDRLAGTRLARVPR